MTASAFAQAPTSVPSGPAAEVQRTYATVKENILKSADRMPAADYTYKPVPDVRSYARVLNHISDAQFRTCGAVNRTSPDTQAKVPPETADKAAIVAALKASFAECDKAFASLTNGNLHDVFTLADAPRSRVGLVWGTVSHDNEQYGALALYLRLKGLTPPTSEK
jgi:hypothetical protein